jgi:hypothetical protein
VSDSLERTNRGQHIGDPCLFSLCFTYHVGPRDDLEVASLALCLTLTLILMALPAAAHEVVVVGDELLGAVHQLYTGVSRALRYRGRVDR